MGMQDAPVEFGEPGIFRHIRHREMARGDDHSVELLLIHVIPGQVMDGEGEVVLGLVPFHEAHGGGKADPVAHARLLHPAFDIVKQHLARRVAGDLLAEMFLKGIVCKFKTFLRPVRPQIAIHRTMDRLAIFIEAGAPGIVPQPPPVRLFLETDDVGDVRPLGFRRLECAQLRKARRSGADDGHSFLHAGAPCWSIPVS